MPPIRINLYSDTQTQPSKAMRQTMAEAEVGDEQSFLDPTVNKLCEITAELTGKEAAVFLPSGTMCNEIALMVHCQPGDDVIADRTAHIINYEAGAPSVLASVMMNPIDGERGMFSLEQFQHAIKPRHRYAPPSRLVCIEQTSNAGGGCVWPLEQIKTISEHARQQDMKVHMDGARLMNAVVASGVSAAEYAKHFDSLWIDLSKGLGCPVGAVLAGSKEFIEKAWRWKQGIGGAMRQAGIIAGAGIYAFEHNVDRLAEDHSNARLFAETINEISGVSLDLEAIQTNIIYFDIGGTGVSAWDLEAQLAAKEIKIGAFSDTGLRAVTHMDVSEEQVREAIQAVQTILSR